MAFTYKSAADRQRSPGPFRIFGRFTKIIIGNCSSPILFSFHGNILLDVSSGFSSAILFLERISFVLFRVVRLNLTAIVVHLLVGFI